MIFFSKINFFKIPVQLLATVQFQLILLRITFYNDGTGDWNVFWFFPGIVYFLVFGFYYAGMGIISIFSVFKQRYHPNLNHRPLCVVALLFSLEFALLFVVFYYTMDLFAAKFEYQVDFNQLRIKTIIILLAHLGLKFLNLFLSLRFSEQIFET